MEACQLPLPDLQVLLSWGGIHNNCKLIGSPANDMGYVNVDMAVCLFIP